MKKILLIILSAIALPVLASDINSGEGAKKVFEKQVQLILNDLDVNKTNYSKNPDAFEEFIETQVGDRLDFEKMSQIALGRYFKDVKAAGKFEIFQKEFERLLIRVYSGSWKNYTGVEIKVIGTPVVDSHSRTQIRAKIINGNQPVQNATFSLFYSKGLWKVYDATFENISLMTSYRNTFNTELQNGSIDQLIDKMRAMKE